MGVELVHYLRLIDHVELNRDEVLRDFALHLGMRVPMHHRLQPP